MKTLLLLILALVLVVALAGGSFVLYEYGKKQGEKTSTPTKTSQTATPSATTSENSEEDINKIIRDCVLGMAAPSIEDVSIDKKYYYTDSSKTKWIRFHVSPLPEGVTDPAYGVMKKVKGGKWTTVDFGTCCIEDNLPTDVKSGLEF